MKLHQKYYITSNKTTHFKTYCFRSHTGRERMDYFENFTENTSLSNQAKRTYLSDAKQQTLIMF